MFAVSGIAVEKAVAMRRKMDWKQAGSILTSFSETRRERMTADLLQQETLASCRSIVKELDESGRVVQLGVPNHV